MTVLNYKNLKSEFRKKQSEDKKWKSEEVAEKRELAVEVHKDKRYDESKKQAYWQYLLTLE